MEILNFLSTELLKGLEVVQDLSQGVLISGSSLVLQGVRREQAGVWAPRSLNQQDGAASSQSVIPRERQVYTYSRRVFQSKA